MTMPDSGRQAALRAVITDFLAERLDGKLEKLVPDDPQHHPLLAQWIVFRIVRRELFAFAVQPLRQEVGDDSAQRSLTPGIGHGHGVFLGDRGS